MENYWNDDSLISAKLKEKRKLLQYEIRMFRETCARFINFKSLSQFEKNLLVESLASHTRILRDFFYDKKVKHINDLFAQDFLSENVDWKKVGPPETEIINTAKKKADKQLAHLSTWRIKLERDGKKGWDFYETLQDDMEKVIKKFNEVSIK